MGKSADYYKKNPKAKKKKAATDSKINKRPEQLKKRRELAKANYNHDKKKGKASRSGKDLSHTKSGLKYKPKSKNRGSSKDSAGDRRSRGKKK